VRFHLSAPVLCEVERALAAAWPEEGCGLLLGPQGELQLADEAVLLRNRAPDRRRGYALGGEELLRALSVARTDGRELRAIFHSHPVGSARLSRADLWALAPAGEALWPGVVQLVAATRREGVREWRGFCWRGAARGYGLQRLTFEGERAVGREPDDDVTEVSVRVGGPVGGAAAAVAVLDDACPG